jgi:hypothetical protein
MLGVLKQLVAPDVIEVDVRVDDDRGRRRHRRDRGGDVGQTEAGIDQDAALRTRDQPAEDMTRLGHQMQSWFNLADLEPLPCVGGEATRGHRGHCAEP